MKVYIEIDSAEELARYLQENSWSGARDTINALNYPQLLDKCREFMDKYDDQEFSDTQLNDIVWFEDDFEVEEDEDKDEDEEDEDCLPF